MVITGFQGCRSPVSSEFTGAGGCRPSAFAPLQMLEVLAADQSLPATLARLCHCFESEFGSKSRCAVSLIDPQDLMVQDVVAPSLPAGFSEAIRGHSFCRAGRCGRAVSSKLQVIAADLEMEPQCELPGFCALALGGGQTSCWSTPILSRTQQVLGIFAVLHDRPSFPTACEQDLITKAVHIAALAIQNAQRDALLSRTEIFLEQGQRLSATAGFAWCRATDEFCCSQQLCPILGIEDGLTVTAAVLLSRVHPEDLGPLRARLERLCQGGDDITHEFRLLMSDRRVRHVRLAGRGVADSLGRWDILGVVQDVTQQRLGEQALEEARADLAYAARVMSLGALSASIAHEIKQPLSGIVINAATCLQMLAADPPELAGARESANRTLRDGNRASDLITRLHALFTQKTVRDETADLNQVTLEAVALALSDLQSRRITLRTQLAEELPTVRGDRIQLHQVILNLILNAADAMSGVDDRPRLLKICTRREGSNEVLLSVEDSGTGFVAQETRLFEPFYTTKSDGMGMGLSISRAIVDRHGGRLWAIANKGPGATFCFTIPCEEPGSAAPDGAAPFPQ
jgi:signal transduction histidine kinase